MGKGERRSTGAWPSISRSARCVRDGLMVRLSGQDSRARHVQPSPRDHRRPARPAQEYVAARARVADAGPLPHLRLAAVGGRRARLRVRLLARLSRRAGGVGGAVRRLRERRAGDDRSVHHRRRRTSGSGCRGWCCCCRTATKGRGRSTRARASSASSELRRGQHAGRASRRRRRSSSTCCARQVLRKLRKPLIVMTPKRCLRLPAARSALERAVRRAASSASSTIRRRRIATRSRARSSVHRQDLLRARRGARAAQRRHHGDHAHRAALSDLGARSGGRARHLRAGRRGRVGAGGAVQHGRQPLRLRATARGRRAS